MSTVDVAQIGGYAKSIGEILSNKKYGLDFYQREYGWQESQVSELIDDLTVRFTDQFDSSHTRSDVASYRPYFLGPIVTAQRNGIRYLVDGQQRLTTVSLLLIHLREQLGSTTDDGKTLDPLIYSTSYGKKSFNLDVAERESCMAAILDGKEYDAADGTESVRNLWNRYQYIIGAFPDDIANGDSLPYFKDWLVNRVVFVDISAPDQDMALEIFETMNDRGLRLSNVDMLKSFLLSRVRDPEVIEGLNAEWRTRVTELSDFEKNADAEFVKAWLRGNYAETIREGKKAAAPGDFDIIGTAFHKWVRDNTDVLGLNSTEDYRTVVERDFMRLSGRYLELLHATNKLTPGLEAVFYNSVTGFTLQLPVILAAVTPDDDDETFRAKARSIASALDIFVVRRIVNFRNFGYSTVKNTMFGLMKRIRNQPLAVVQQELANWLSGESERLGDLLELRLHQRNKSHVKYLLARLTAWIDSECGVDGTFAQYVDRSLKHPFEVEHIWANHFERHIDEFDNEHEFANHRNRIGDLVLLPKDFNASYGDLPYEDKVAHYLGRNALARSLHEMSYKNNPSFINFFNKYGLEFRPYPTEFRRDNIDERQRLYLAMAEAIWDPAATGLPDPSIVEDANETYHYVAFGEGDSRNWADAIKYGFVCAGQGEWYSRTIKMLRPGDRVFVHSPKHGYVGYGVVNSSAVPARDFYVDIDGMQEPILGLPLVAVDMGRNMDDDLLTEWVVGVDWLVTHPIDEAYWVVGMYANQNTVTRLRDPFTLEHLRSRFLDDVELGRQRHSSGI